MSPSPDPQKPPDYRRPEMPFERRSGGLTPALRWSAAGLEFGVAVVLFFLGGKALDANLQTGPWLSVAGALFGVAVGTWLLVRAALRASSTTSSSTTSTEVDRAEADRGGAEGPEKRAEGRKKDE